MSPFNPHAAPHLPSAPRGHFLDCARGCGCQPADRSRRLFTGLIAASALAPALGQAQEASPGNQGVSVGRRSRFTQLVPADQIEEAAAQQYRQMLQEAAQQRALAPANQPQLQRLRAIAQRLIPYTQPWNDRAARWQWEVNLIGSPELNAFCMPGGKIAFYYGILERLQLSDDEVAMIMGHEMAHALREHARERMGKTTATRLGAGLLSQILGLGDMGNAALSIGSQLLTLNFSREDESEADLVGLDLAARAGYDPRAGITLWQKMGQTSRGAPPQWLSTHPSGPSRIRDIEAHIPQVSGLYERAEKPSRRHPIAPPLPRA